MITLIKYEVKKFHQEFKWYVLASAILGILAVALIAVNQPSQRNILGSVAFFVTFAVVVSLLVGPLIQSFIIYNGDLNKKHAVLEAAFPFVGWQRLTAKLITAIAYIFLCGLVAFGIAKLLLLATGYQGYLNNLEITLNERRVLLGELEKMGLGNILKYFLGMVVSLSGSLIFVNFFSTLHSTLRYKLKPAVPVTIFLAVLLIALSTVFQTCTENVVLFTSPLNGPVMPMDVLGIILTVSGFFAIAYMLDRKTEV